ncbi:Cytosine deaminase [Nostocoides japonicum T1-X7]|uniref:Cytosine deaminase n=1 Tax=Nostocoides japonicum T1-X7 TaxID=1194083 RepID=A0A077LTK4_9MICO|nr:amidohydrolase [Tetrasphaera japonica]CCH76908.1 Cytosine deaminase [Tetrasphaera japonica T1-X7]
MTTLIENVLVPGHDEPTTIVVEDGRITSLGAPQMVHGTTASVGGADPAERGDGTDRIDGAGLLALPGLIDAHAHIDKTLFSGPWVPNPGVEQVAERIAYERRVRDDYGLPNADYVAALVERMIVGGTTHVRTHTDVDPGVGLRGVEVVAEVAERYADAITIEQVAFPQGGLITNPGTLDLLAEATKAGATTIGGLDPAGFDQAPNEHLDAIFELAVATGSGLDIHLHDDGTLGAWEMQQIARRTVDHGLGGRVAISHAFAIAHEPTQDALIAAFAEAGVALNTAAVYDVPVPPLDKLAAAGVAYGSGSDGINDLWGPYGDGDMLRRAMLVGYRNSARTDAGLALALDTATYGAARVLGIEAYGIAPGAPADLVLVRARSVAEAVAAVPPRELVLKRGRVVARGGTFVG